MEIEIDEKIIAKTTNCKLKFACLQNDLKSCCKVEECINNKVLFIKCLESKYCSYKMSFGNSFMCTWPADARAVIACPACGGFCRVTS